MKYVNVKNFVKLSQEDIDNVEKLTGTTWSDIKRPDLERGLVLLSLCREFKAKRCLDIGTAGFFSAKCMALSGAVIDTIDIKGEQPSQEGIYKNINFIKSDSKEIVPKLDYEYDVCFIDGDHSYETVRVDIRNCKKKCKVIVCHDFGNLADVTRAINEEIDVKEIIIEDRMWYGAPYENGIDKNGNIIDYGLVIWQRDDL